MVGVIMIEFAFFLGIIGPKRWRNFARKREWIFIRYPKDVVSRPLVVLDVVWIFSFLAAIIGTAFIFIKFFNL